MTPSVMQLACSCNNYPWGKKGTESLSARLCAQTPNTGFKIEESKEYAEMWMGDYPVLPAKVLETGEELHKVIDENKEQLLGKKCIERFGGVLPFLPKILSIAKALPLQIHPDKELSAKLHKKDPEKFTDTNHKPEIAIALSKFEVFAGWKPTKDIEAVFGLEPLQQFLPEKHDPFNNDTLRHIGQAILEASDETIAETQDKLSKIPKEKLGQAAYILDLLPRLQKQYSKEDPGNLVALLMMNFMTLSVGDAIFIPTDSPHAYLSGDIVECMARSNNVINTGFCPRAERDNIELFTSAMTFVPHSVDEALLKPTKSDKGKHGKTVVYQPDMSEFNMLRTCLGKGEKEVVEAIGGPSVLFSTQGKGTLRAEGKEWEIKEGFVFFVGPGQELQLESDQGLEVYLAYAE